MSTIRRIPIVVLATLVLGGCFSRGHTPTPAERRVRVEVENHNWSTVNIYALSGGLAVRMGTVNTNQKLTLDTPVGMDATSGGLRFLVDPIGSTGAYLTEDISAGPGDTIHLRIENNLALSSWTVS